MPSRSSLFTRPRPRTLAICLGITAAAALFRAVQYRIALAGVREGEARDRARVAAGDAAQEARRAPPLDYQRIWARVVVEEERIAAEEAAAAMPAASAPP